MSDKPLDFDNRDPNDMNNHLRVEFEDVIAEPAGAHSNDCVWRISFCCFQCSKLCCYRCLTLFCGCCCALSWGFEFACLSFSHVWCYTPWLRKYAIGCGCMQKMWGTCVQCWLAPIAETCGLCLNNIRVDKS